MDQHLSFRPGVSPGPTSDRPPAEFHDVPSATVAAGIKACAGPFPVLYGLGRATSTVVERFVRELDGQFPSAYLAVMAAPVPGQGRRPRYRDPLTPFRKRVTTIWFVGRLGEPCFDILIRQADRWARLGVGIRLLALHPEGATPDDWDRVMAQLVAIKERHNLGAGTLVLAPDPVNAPQALLQAVLADGAGLCSGSL